MIFRYSYATILLKLTLTPLLKHGIALEAHGQNITVRICKKTLEIKGFAYRDLGGFRMHMPTLHSQGYRLDTMPTGSAITSYDLSEVWNKMHHAVFQNHLGPLISALKLHDQGGWAIVREVVREVLSSEEGEELLRFILKETMAFKCFLRMSMAGKYRDVSYSCSVNCLIYSDVNLTVCGKGYSKRCFNIDITAMIKLRGWPLCASQVGGLI